MNERFRFLKYGVGNKFAPHCDGRYPRSDTEVSMTTVHFYLNTVAKGGQTRFFLDKYENNFVDCEAVTGRIGIFR